MTSCGVATDAPAHAEAFLQRAQQAGVPVHVGTVDAAWVCLGFLVRSARNTVDEAELVSTSTGTLWKVPLRDLRVLVSVTGDCWSAPARAVDDGGRRDAVTTSLSGLAMLLANPDLTASERVRLERLAGDVARLHA